MCFIRNGEYLVQLLSHSSADSRLNEEYAFFNTMKSLLKSNRTSTLLI